jgi:hypothetical protein
MAGISTLCTVKLEITQGLIQNNNFSVSIGFFVTTVMFLGAYGHDILGFIGRILG